jgi:hypothetical protein
VGGDLDLFVLPLRGPLVARDQAHAVQATEVAEHEHIARLRALRRLARGARRRTHPSCALEKRVLLGGTRLDVGPASAHPVLTGVDQCSGLGHAALVDHVLRHTTSLAHRMLGRCHVSQFVSPNTRTPDIYARLVAGLSRS